MRGHVAQETRERMFVVVQMTLPQNVGGSSNHLSATEAR